MLGDMPSVKQLTMEVVTDKAKLAGFRADLIPMIVSIVWGESGGNAYAVNVNDQTPTLPDGTPNPTYMSADLGLVQFNTYWNIDAPTLLPAQKMTIAQMFDPDRSLAKMNEVTAGGTKNLKLWSVYVNEKWQQFYAQALAIAKAKGII